MLKNKHIISKKLNNNEVNVVDATVDPRRYIYRVAVKLPDTYIKFVTWFHNFCYGTIIPKMLTSFESLKLLGFYLFGLEILMV